MSRKACPNCGDTQFRRAESKEPFAFTYDRVCSGCGERVTSTPRWGGAVFIAVGVGFILFYTGLAALICLSAISRTFDAIFATSVITTLVVLIDAGSSRGVNAIGMIVFGFRKLRSRQLPESYGFPVLFRGKRKPPGGK
ncbi:MAG TPA: hypothetical protein VG269_14605 [Tepidisphaeraceae bacterium]|jgi:uncharacterized protein (DUF983 family)|nr:hypothetical protein [Tepidisphaeraceae bacterium]